MSISTENQSMSKRNADMQARQNQDSNDEVRYQSRKLIPAADIQETKEGATLYIDLPGVNNESLDIAVDNNVLSINAEVDLNIPDDLSPTYMDIQAGAYSRQFTLSAELDSSKIEAHLKNGVLALHIPRSEKHKPRKIEVKQYN